MHKDFELIDIQAKIIPNNKPNKPKKSTNSNKNIIVEEKNDDINELEKELEDLPKTKIKKSKTIIIDVDNNSASKKKSAKK